jgi:pimeloyl-ACP methyl ester carboxylesterase
VPKVQRLQLTPAGHMLHHDQPEALARALQAFLDAD